MTRTQRTAALFLAAISSACGASMRPIPDDVEPAPRTIGASVLADAGAVAQMDAAARQIGSAHEPSKPIPCSTRQHQPLEVRHVAPDEWIIGAGVLDVVRSEGKAVLAPKVDSTGHVLGQTIQDVGEDSCLGALGFRDGDVIESVNGYPLETDWSTFPAVSASITKNGEAVVRFERNGRPMTEVYEVRGE